MARAIVVGSNRGIGLELCRQLAARGYEVVAACRSSSPELDAVPHIVVHEGVDVTKPDTVETVASEVGDGNVDLLLVVAGVMKPSSLDDLNVDGIRRQFDVNALGALTTTVALLPCLAKGSKIGLITSRMGSIGDNTSGGSYGYRMSKAALNMAGRSLAIDLKPRGVAVAILHPGWVKTDMTGGQGLIDVETSATGLIERMVDLTMETSGSFLHENGEKLPW